LNYLVIVLISLTTYIFGKFYATIFKKYSSKNKTPTGFGYIYLAIISFSLLFFNESIEIYKILPNLILLNISTFLYYIDDILNLKPILRIFIIISTALVYTIINHIFLNQLLIDNNLFIIIFTLLAFLLVNVLNFYDGSDLNLASIIFFTGLILIVYSSNSFLHYKDIGFILISSILGFIFINYKPKSLYLGDSGSFCISFVLIILLTSSFKESFSIFSTLLSLISLPIFDVLYVLLIRIKSSHDLLSRNYLHLYQRIQIRYGKFYYLLPVPLNTILIILCRKLIESYWINNIYSSFLSIIIITPLNYFLIRYNFVEKKYFFGDGNNS